MRKIAMLTGGAAFVAFVMASPAAAQEGQGAPSDSATVQTPVATPDSGAMPAGGQADTGHENMAQEPSGVTAETTPDTVPEHDWEFTLSSTKDAPQASGTVMVAEGDAGNTFWVQVDGLPAVDSLDQEGRDVNAYTVWVVPSKERVKESTLAGALTVGPGGSGSLEGHTDLPSFGIIVTATPDGAPEQLSGVPVLSGIPVQGAAQTSEAPADEKPEDMGASPGEPSSGAGQGQTPAPPTAQTPAPTPPSNPDMEQPEN